MRDQGSGATRDQGILGCEPRALTPTSWRGSVVGPGRTVIPWLLVVALGTAPAIFFDVGTGRVPAWFAAVQLIVGASAVVLCAALRPLRPFVRAAVVLAALVALPMLVARGDHTMPAVQTLLGGGAFVSAMQPGQTAKLVVAIVMVLLLLMMGCRPRDFFLRAGNLTAPIRPEPLLGFPRSDPWPRFGIVWGVGIAAALGVAQYFLIRPTAADLGVLLPAIPAILVFAALNAFSEEMTYRAPLIATVEPVVGSSQALWLSAVYFGVAHYFGIPGGLVGALLSIFMGWILGKAMLETRGMFWPWVIHFLSDVVIFAFLAMAM